MILISHCGTLEVFSIIINRLGLGLLDNVQFEDTALASEAFSSLISELKVKQSFEFSSNNLYIML